MKRASALFLAMLLLTACGSKKQAGPPITSTTAESTTTTTPIGAPPAIKITPIAKLSTPTYLTQRANDPVMYVTERAGTIRMIKDGAVVSTPLLDISSDVSTDGERGLLSMAFSPTNPQLFYVYYTNLVGNIQVTEFAISPDGTVDMHTRRELLTVPHSSQTNHNGGQLQFGPDNNLYIGVGDGGGAGDPNKNGQNLAVLLGKILRINPTANGTLPYTIPYDNPFAKQTGAQGEIWAYGVRNPWRFSFDMKDGQDQGIWIGDVGQDKWEEVDHIANDAKGGQNYGWSLREGTHNFSGDKPTAAIDPIYEYSHANSACSITGGYVYRGSALPDMVGRYVFGDYCTGQLMALTQKGTGWDETNLNAKVSGLESFGRANDGEIYTVSIDGDIGRIDAG